MHTVYIGIVISFFTFFIYLLFYNFQPVVAIRSLVTGAVLLILYNLVLLVPETARIYRQSLERKIWSSSSMSRSATIRPSKGGKASTGICVMI